MAARDSTVAVVACGPMGLCAIVAAANLRTQLLFAVDSVRDRLGRAEKLQAKPLNPLDVMANLQAQIEPVIEGRGADVVIEAVGLSPALRKTLQIVRPVGFISSIGVHSQNVSATWPRFGIILLMTSRYRGQRKRLTSTYSQRAHSSLTVEIIDTDLTPVRTSGFKWADAPLGAFSVRL